jgi:hypothetical protein
VGERGSAGDDRRRFTGDGRVGACRSRYAHSISITRSTSPR